MKELKNLFLAMLAVATLISFSACDSDDDDDDPDPVVSGDTTVVIVNSSITENTTWQTGKVYQLATRVIVESGATLDIQPGVIVKGEAGQGVNSTVLLVARGATINAMGTASAPIIFTSIADEITPEQVAAGDFQSPNLSPTQAGFWGGVIVLGSASISAYDTEVQIESIPEVDARGLYGGLDDDDNSGIISHISIRHSGVQIGPGNQINGLTLGGVGSGTTIEMVEIVANLDDGIEWYGGNVDLTGALVWNAGDDALDTDQDWIGTCSNFIVVTPVGGSAFELDGPEGSINRGNHTFTNGLVYAGELGEELIDMDSATNAILESVYFYGLVTPLEVEYGTEYVGTIRNIEYTFPATWDHDGDGDEENPTPEVPFPSAAEIFTDVPASELTEVAENANTVGPTSDAGFEWTWAGQSGILGAIGL